MPHCLVEYSKEISKEIAVQQIMQSLHEILYSSTLFDPGSVKIRSIEHENYLLPVNYENFIHVTLCIFTGRSKEQKRDLARSIHEYLSSVFSDLKICLTSEVCEIDQNSYFNS